MDISIRRHSPVTAAYKLFALCMLAAATVAGCGGGGGTDTASQVTSAAVAPQISAQPQNVTVNSGETATFSVTATGTAPLSYQWMKDSTAISSSSATSASYTTPATTSSDNGASFTVMVTNSAGTITSSAATLTVNSSSNPPAATPTFSVPAGTYSSAQSVKLACSTASSTIYYTTDGTTPTHSSKVYSAVISVSSTETLEAICTASGYTDSAVASAAYTISGTTPVAATPTFSVPAGTYSSAQSVKLACSTASSTIYYTTNGSTPTHSSSVYSAAISVASTETIKAVCSASGYTDSAVASAAYTINSTPMAATPTFSVPGGVYTSAQSVALACSTASSTIYYTTNGTTPTTSSSVYSAALSVSSTETLEAICTASGFSNSAVASAVYTINTSGVYALPANRTTIWSNAGMLTKGGIPSASWPICNSTALTPSGTADDSAQINNQINQCAAGTVVQLGAGTFVMGTGVYVEINKGVVLRGAGAGTTILKNPRNVFATASIQAPGDATPIVVLGPGLWVNPDGDARCNGPTAYQTQYMQLLSADGAQGASSVTVANGSIFSAGQMVLLDETSGASWQPDVAQISTSVWASPDYAVAWDIHKPAASNADDPLQTGVTPSTSNNYAGTGSGSDSACWFGRQDRPQNEIKQIASVSGNTITFTSPLTKAYRTSHYAELTTYTGSNAPVVNAGLEQLSVVGGGNGAVRFQNTMYSWVRNIEVTEWWGEGINLENSFRDEVRDSYIHDAAWPEPGGAGYALSISNASSEVLVENNLVVKANKVIVGRSSGAGSVVGYNYMDDGYIATDEPWIEVGLNASHQVGSHHVLFEGNQSFNIDSDDTHGNSTFLVFFRNYVTTVRSTFTSDYTGNTIN
ncbi:MAG TPA: chitobiase/beta-hexosaminidase C-terminal domain-containing protein, partial [Steroidobacteraceae bacterium]|nr:chitobiase/beta-hexosaminidase C-terminal domain-containing protein [Steroidobacteraceae bacterium]